MKLTRFQYRVLRSYLRIHETSLARQMFRNCWKQWLLLVVFGTFSYFALASVGSALGWLFMGIFAGALLRDIGYCQAAFRMWPVTNQIMNWERVSQMIQSAEAGVRFK